MREISKEIKLIKLSLKVRQVIIWHYGWTQEVFQETHQTYDYAGKGQTGQEVVRARCQSEEGEEKESGEIPKEVGKKAVEDSSRL